jgi:hypothetical protein
MGISTTTGEEIMPYDLFDENGKRKMRPGNGKAPEPLDDVQRELVRADMQFLIDQEKKNGDWTKWEESQRPVMTLRQVSTDGIVSVRVTASLDENGDVVFEPEGEGVPTFDITMRYMRQEITMRYARQEMPSRIVALEADRQRMERVRFYTGQITAEIFEHYVGRAPQQDDLERANCNQEGYMGHNSCGWCSDCQRPRFMCGHYIEPRR